MWNGSKEEEDLLGSTNAGQTSIERLCGTGGRGILFGVVFSFSFFSDDDDDDDDVST